jgi:hypothetical protein
MFEYAQSQVGVRKRLGWPWWLVVLMSVGAAVFLFDQLHKKMTPETWATPPQSQLQTATGHFVHGSIRSRLPYIFEVNDGNRIYLACEPDRRTNICGQYPLNIAEIIGQPVEIGYFHFENTNIPNLSNVLVTVKRDERYILDYESSRARLKVARTRQDEVKMSPLILLFTSLGPMLVLMAMAYVAFTKLAYSRMLDT